MADFQCVIKSIGPQRTLAKAETALNVETWRLTDPVFDWTDPEPVIRLADRVPIPHVVAAAKPKCDFLSHRARACIVEDPWCLSKDTSLSKIPLV